MLGTCHLSKTGMPKPKSSKHSAAFRAKPMRKKRAAGKRSKVSRFQEKTSSPEFKNVDVGTTANLTISSNVFTAPFLINGMTQGIGNGERIGRRATMKSLLYRLQFSTATGSSNNTFPLRVLVVYDRQANAAPPVAAAVLTPATFIGNMNLSNSDRFLILSDDIYESSSTGPTHGVKYVKMSLDTLFIGTDNTAASISNGAVYTLLASTGSTSVTVEMQTRIRYVDV